MLFSHLFVIWPSPLMDMIIPAQLSWQKNKNAKQYSSH